MSNIVQTTDFKTGEFRIPKTTFQTETVQKFIDKYERKYLIRLFGRELYDLFIANLVAGVPTSARFLAVFNEFTDENDCGICDSDGMKEMISGFIYFHYVRRTFTRNTTNGVKQTVSENSDSLETVSADLTTRFNDSVNMYECIQKKMCDDPATYPEFNGVLTERILPI
jgi:hypothetical protein